MSGHSETGPARLLAARIQADGYLASQLETPTDGILVQ